MKLTSIKICNFRSFYGKTPEILLAVGDVRNITIVHGGTGAGKTSFLNAFTWALYERFSAAFAAVEQLVNKRAIAEADIGQAVECWVEVAWEHDGKRYRVKRSSRVYRNERGFEAGKTKLFMQVAGDDGQWYLPPQQPEDVINQILPSSLHQYFFFDGERIEHIVRSDKKAEIAEATKMLLGVEVINRSIKHLGEAKKSLESELKAIGDSQTQDLLKQQGKFQKESDRLIQRLSEIEQELECQQTLKQETSNCLRELSAAKELQERLLELENQRGLNQDSLKQTKEALKKAISSKGYTLLLSEKTTDFAAFTAELKQGGKLTNGVSREFLDHLIQKGRCLCGTDLHAGSRSYKNLNIWLTKAASSVVEETAIRMGAQVDIIEQQAVAFWEDVDREQARIQELRQVISQLEDELHNIQERLRKDPSEEIRNLQKRLDEIEQKIRDLTLEQGANQQQITNFKQEIESLSKQVAKQEMNEARQILAQRRIVAAQDAIERLMEVKNRQEHQFRHQLEKRVQELFSEISVTPYLPKITDKYELILVENTSGFEMTVAASTGENQILSLCFISSIIDRVREWSLRKMLMMPDSSTFPIVMDSAFGSLDEISRRQIAKTIPELANQLVVLASKTQWRGEVEAEMAARVGREYVMTYYSSKPDCQQDAIELGGEIYPLIRQSPNEFEYTEIREVQR